jgi:hypothetical protein
LLTDVTGIAIARYVAEVINEHTAIAKEGKLFRRSKTNARALRLRSNAAVEIGQRSEPHKVSRLCLFKSVVTSGGLW